MLLTHFVIGKITMLVGGADLTPDRGRGSGDAPHFRFVAAKCKLAWPKLAKILGDKAYGNKGNYRVADRMGILLFTRTKAGEKRELWGGQATFISDLEKAKDGAFEEDMRFRNKGEGHPSRDKRGGAFIKSRRRSDAAPLPETNENDETLCDYEDKPLKEILDTCTKALGATRLNEGWARIVRANLRRVVQLEFLHDERMRLSKGTTFGPIRIVKEKDLFKNGPGEAAGPEEQAA